MGKGRSGKAKGQEAVILVSEEKVMEVEGGTGCREREVARALGSI